MNPTEAANELARRTARIRSMGDREIPTSREDAFASEFVGDLINSGWHPPNPRYASKPGHQHKESSVDDNFYVEDEPLEDVKKAWENATDHGVTQRPSQHVRWPLRRATPQDGFDAHGVSGHEL